MNKAGIVLALVIVLFFPFELQLINLTRANPISVPRVPAIEIGFPYSSIGGYVNSTVEFGVNVNVFLDSQTINSISYSLDGGALVEIGDLKTTFDDRGPSFKTYKATVLLPDLSEGTHTLIASANGMNDSTTFIVNNHYHITALNVLSPNGQVYTSNTLPLMFTYTGEITNAHYYLYRGNDLVSENSLSGDISLDNLSDGFYDLYIFVTTQYGQDSKQVHFSIIGLPIIMGITALLIIFVCASLLFYYLKRVKKLHYN